MHLRSHRRKKQSSPAVASRLSWCLAKSTSLMGMACAWLMLPLCCMARRSCSCTARQRCQIKTTYPILIDVHHWKDERMADAPNLQAQQHRLLSEGICIHQRLRSSHPSIPGQSIRLPTWTSLPPAVQSLFVSCGSQQQDDSVLSTFTVDCAVTCNQPCPSMQVPTSLHNRVYLHGYGSLTVKSGSKNL